MSEPLVNEATGEVSVTIEGIEYRLKASFKNLAELQKQSGVVGLTMLYIHINQADQNALFQGMRCLCVSGNAEKLDDIHPLKHLAVIQGAIIKAITWGLPDVDVSTPSKKKALTKRTATAN